MFDKSVWHFVTHTPSPRFIKCLLVNLGMLGVVWVTQFMELSINNVFGHVAPASRVATFVLWRVAWLTPLLVLAAVYTTTSMKKVMEEFTNTKNQTPHRPPPLQLQIADMVMHASTTMVSNGLICLMHALPVIGTPLAVVLDCIVFAFMTFSVPWSNYLQYTFAAQCEQFETRWPWYVSFCALPALVAAGWTTNFFEYTAFMAVCGPLWQVLAMHAMALKHHVPDAPLRLPILTCPLRVAVWCRRRLVRSDN